MITLLSTPSPFAGAKNPIVITAETDAYITAAAVQGSCPLRFDSIPVNDDSFNLEYGDNNFVFTFKDTPDDSGFEVLSNSDGHAVDLEDFVNQLAIELFAGNYYLRRDFESITSSYAAGEAQLLFLAKDTIAGVISSTVYVGTWPAAVQVGGTLGVVPAYEQNFTLECRLEFEDDYGSDIFPLLLVQSLYPNTEAQATFYLQDALYHALKNESSNFNLPSYGQETISQANKLVRRYRAALVEKYGADPTYRKQVVTDELFALFGGLNPVDYPDVNFLSYLSGNKKFLSFGGTKTVSPRQHEYLHFPCYTTGPVDLKLHADIYYTDGSSTLNQLLLSRLSAAQYEVYIFPAGYTQLDLGSYAPTKTVAYYDLKIRNAGGTTISELKRYRVTFKENYRERFFLYLNSLGAWETLRATGVSEFNPTYTGEVAERLLEHDYNVPDAQYESLGKITGMQYITATGYYSQADIDHIAREFMNSERVYLVGPETGGDPTGFYIPIILTDGEQKALSNNQTRFALEFKYRIAYDFGVHSQVFDITE